ncbi:MAG: DUF167 family protein [Notoacmeibacter sp.]|nr:DUF167 family protein [Notoacmeibacter sp.]
MAEPWRIRGGAVELHVRLTPKSSRDAIDGTGETADGAVHIKARVRAVPEKGKANAALEKLIADWLGVPRSAVSIAAGSTGRLKAVSVSGDPAGIEALLRDRLKSR